MKRWTHQRAEGMVNSFFLACLEGSGSSLEFGNVHGRVVSVSPRLTFLMQDWGIQRSAPLKFLVGVRREATRLLKTVCDIDIKTQHIEWCQLKFHSVPFGKLGSWAFQCDMNNETSLALLIFYLMWNSPLLLPQVPRGLVCKKYRCREKKEKRIKFLFYICMKLGMKVKCLWLVFFEDFCITAPFSVVCSKASFGNSLDIVF